MQFCAHNILDLFSPYHSIYDTCKISSYSFQTVHMITTLEHIRLPPRGLEVAGSSTEILKGIVEGIVEEVFFSDSDLYQSFRFDRIEY